MNQNPVVVGLFLLIVTGCSHPSIGGDGFKPDTGGSGGNQGTGGSSGSGGTGGATVEGTGGQPIDAAPMDTPPEDVADDTGGPDAAEDAPPADDAVDGAGDGDDGGFPVGGPIGSCVPLNWIVQGSQSAPADPPALAVDDVLETRWSSGVPQSPGINYQIDFGGLVRLGRLRLNSSGSPGDFPRGFDVTASADGLDFANVVASAPVSEVAPADNITTIDLPPAILRVLRIQLTGTSGSWWSIHELGVDCQISDGNGGVTTDVTPDNLRCQAPDGGAPDAGSGPFDPTGWTLTASSTSTMVTDVITNAVDGRAATRWSSGVAQAPGQFFKIDLGSEACVGQIRLTSSGTDFVVGYKVAVSVDDTTYLTIAKGTGALVTAIRLPPHRARYVRIETTGSSGSWWSINELTIGP